MNQPQSLLTLAAIVGLFVTSATSVGAADDASFTDPRDGTIYPTIEIAGLTWMARHLNYAAPGSYCYMDNPENCETDGRLYPWEVALTSCPAGWHLSTEYEWQAMETALGMPEELLEGSQERGVEGDALKIGGSAGLNIPFAGWRNPLGEWRRRGEGAALWVADELEIGLAQHRDLNINRKGIWRSPVNKPYALSVRCVRNHHLPGMIDWKP